MDKFIIFDETNGKSAKGKTLKWIAKKYGIVYVTDSEGLLSKLKENTKGSKR
jgi:hypothetical protein